MENRIIKIIKRETDAVSKPPAPAAEEILIQQRKGGAEGERDMAHAVKNWINERREKSRMEEMFSKNLLFSRGSEVASETA